MKRLSCLALLLFPVLFASAQTEECKKVRTGSFQSTVAVGNEKVVTMIYREKDKQVEVNEQMGIKMEFVVKWTSDCTYELSKPKLLKGKLPGVSDTQILYVKILSVKKDAYTAEVSSNFHEEKDIFDFSIVK